MALLKRKKEQPWNLEITEGVHLGRPDSVGQEKAIWNCLPKGLFVFLVVFGSFGGFLSAFEVKYHAGFVGIAFFLSAMFLSSLFAFRKNWHKDFGYIIYFMLYVMGIYTYRSYVNSGFAVVLNEVRQRGEVYFGINAGDEFSEAIEDREMAATMAILFIGLFVVLLLNIFISNYMHLKFTAIVILPMYVFPMYFRQEPQIGYVLCLLAGLMGIYIFKNSGHFLDNKKRSAYEREKKTKVPVIRYTQSNGTYRGVLISIVICMLLLRAGTVLFNSFDFQRYYKENELKAASHEGISGFLMMGFRLFYNDGYSWSGMSGGDLNDISAVRPDESTHLVVRFAPYSKETVYLKAFIGGDYEDGHWSDELQVPGDPELSSQEIEITNRAAVKQLKKLYQEGGEYRAKAKMDVINQGANSCYEYVPYYGTVEEHTYEMIPEELKSTNDYESVDWGSYENEKNYILYPNIGYHAEIKDSTKEQHRWVAEECKSAVQGFLDEAGISPGDPQAVEKVVKYFEKEYVYSYTPGRVPKNQDPLSFFLKKNRKGVCIHFASAATMIFRELGIPARFVEGYAIDYNTVLAGTVREDLKYEDYYEGYSELGETKVMEVEVPGGNAHAWVEVYQEGKGWVIVDPTPAVFEEAEEGGFLDSLQRLWEEPTGVNISNVIPKFSFAFFTSNGAKVLVTCLVILGMLVLVAWQVRKKILRYRSWHTKDLRANLLWYYRDMCEKIKKKDAQFASYSVPAEQIPYLIRRYEKKKGESINDEHIVHLYEQICFSPKEPAAKDYEIVLQVLKKIR